MNADDMTLTQIVDKMVEIQGSIADAKENLKKVETLLETTKEKIKEMAKQRFDFEEEIINYQTTIDCTKTLIMEHEKEGADPSVIKPLEDDVKQYTKERDETQQNLSATIIILIEHERTVTVCDDRILTLKVEIVKMDLELLYYKEAQAKRVAA